MTPAKAGALAAAASVILAVAAGIALARTPPPESRLPDAHPDALPEVRVLAPGFEHGAYTLPAPSRFGDGKVWFVRIDPRLVDLEVKAASQGDRRLRTVAQWADPKAATTAVINASMFQDDHLTSIGHFAVRGTVQNPTFAKDQNAMFVTDPVDPSAAPAAIVDLACGDRDALVAGWRTRVQSIRMLGCAGENVWSAQPRLWSAALVGQDRAGRILFLHVRSPYTMHDLTEMLRTSPLDLVALHYGDGGPPAAMYVRSRRFEATYVGSYETGILEDDNNRDLWALPNVLVATAKKAQP